MSENKQPQDPLLDLFGEAGVLKSVRRSGWWLIGIKDGESVADHSFRAALIGYVLAKEEGVDPYPVVMMSLLNDLHEARINDLHKVGHYYIDFKDAEKKAAADQRKRLPEGMQADMEKWMDDLLNLKTPEAEIARDADILECMIQGKEYADQGKPQALDWSKRAASLLKTKTAKRLVKTLQDWDSEAWWHAFLKMER